MRAETRHNLKQDRFSQVTVRTNRYSVPTPVAERQRVVTLVSNDRLVRVLDGATLVAEHPRSWGRRQLIEGTARADRRGTASAGSPMNS